MATDPVCGMSVKESAAEFTRFLKRDSAAAVFRKHGFEPVGP